jgi:hypothetical protein
MSDPVPNTATAAVLAEVEDAVQKLQAQAAPAPALTADQALEAWLTTYVRNTPYAAETRVWNSIFNGVAQIRAALALANL